MEAMDNISDEENDLQTSDYFSENTPKSCKSFTFDHKYVIFINNLNIIYILLLFGVLLFKALSPTYSVVTCLSTSSESSSTSNNFRLKLIKKQKQFKRRRLFEKEIETNKNDFKWTPLSERQQLAIALQLSSHDSQCKPIPTNNTNHLNIHLIVSNFTFILNLKQNNRLISG